MSVKPMIISKWKNQIYDRREALSNVDARQIISKYEEEIKRLKEELETANIHACGAEALLEKNRAKHVDMKELVLENIKLKNELEEVIYGAAGNADMLTDAFEILKEVEWGGEGRRG